MPKTGSLTSVFPRSHCRNRVLLSHASRNYVLYFHNSPSARREDGLWKNPPVLVLRFDQQPTHSGPLSRSPALPLQEFIDGPCDRWFRGISLYVDPVSSLRPVLAQAGRVQAKNGQMLQSTC
nr:hypothetical protein CFP56_10074 [Quercus suber]